MFQKNWTLERSLNWNRKTMIFPKHLAFYLKSPFSQICKAWRTIIALSLKSDIWSFGVHYGCRAQRVGDRWSSWGQMLIRKTGWEQPLWGRGLIDSPVNAPTFSHNFCLGFSVLLQPNSTNNLGRKREGERVGGMAWMREIYICSFSRLGLMDGFCVQWKVMTDVWQQWERLFSQDWFSACVLLTK